VSFHFLVELLFELSQVLTRIVLVKILAHGVRNSQILGLVVVNVLVSKGSLLTGVVPGTITVVRGIV
jgi:hypothetical protein